MLAESKVELNDCVVLANSAGKRGGAVFTDGGSYLTLSNETILEESSAEEEGDSLFTGAASVFYTLPAPLGRWIAASHACIPTDRWIAATHACIPTDRWIAAPLACIPRDI